MKAVGACEKNKITNTASTNLSAVGAGARFHAVTIPLLARELKMAVALSQVNSYHMHGSAKEHFNRHIGGAQHSIASRRYA